ncbi:hypothetical protein [Maribacter aestuarii]|uniref:hypothetical protein n=1 Tax=Maribacter aestuarii TaxID=1130723 RepID=UPI00248BAC87|nr:hypothetical protein [Maribacter aestuarii]
MKNYLVLSVTLVFALAGCKSDKKTETDIPLKELNILEKVAQAHGYDNWKNVSSLKFTFNVDRDSSHFERTWLWQPKSNEVVFMTREDTITYNRKAVDSLTAKTDGGFVNDKFWLLAPFQLVWDQKGFTYEHSENQEAPISKEKMHKLTTVYANEGGYTPGDAYDYYFGDDYVIKEWVFRKGNQEEPSMVTSWEDYKTLQGLDIATMHKMPEANFQLYFTDIEVK